MAPSRINDSISTISHSRSEGLKYNDYGWLVRNARGYQLLEQPYGTLKPMRVIHIGAGAAGITFSKFAEESLQNVEVQIYEKNKDVGGTWLENRYPGCACDIPSVCYQFTWERNPNWSKYYSTSPEIWRYFRDTAHKHNLMKYIKLEHTIMGAYWDSEKGLWNVHVQGPDGVTFIDTCNVLINGGGVLNNWQWPDIKGLHSFKGILQHSAHYDEEIDLTGKRVAVLGCGSSGVQIVSHIAPIVKEMYTWIRSPTWITAGFAQRFAGEKGENFSCMLAPLYTEEQKERFRQNPELYLKYSKMIESELNQRFKFILNGTVDAEAAKAYARQEMTERLSQDQELMEAIIPKNFGVGCRRPTPGNGYLEALTQENVTVFTSPMREVTPEGFIDAEGREHNVDVIICATGFNTSWIPRFPVEANGRSIAKMWEKEAVSYISLGVPDIPNYFMMGGPYGPLGHGSFLPTIEILAKNAIQCIQKMQKDRIKSLTPKPEIATALKEHAALFLHRTAWSSGCSSWFKQGTVDGPLPMFPGSRLTFFDLMATPRFEDYNIEYCNQMNMFEFLGNGFNVREFDGRDLSYYLGLLNGRDVQINLEEDLSQELRELTPAQ